MPSSYFSLPNIGTANLTAIIATSSLYVYLIALHQHQQKQLLADQEREQERARLSQLQAQSQKQKQKIQTQPPNSRGGYTDSQSSSGSRPRRYSENQSQIGNQDRRQYSGSNSQPNSNTYTNTYRPPPFGKMSKTFSPSEVAAHKDAENGMYLIIDENVYDVTNFLEEHPGGAKILKRVAGKDASKQFWKYHNESVLKKYGEKLKIGAVGEKAKL
ncbi:uncharacterized protein EAE97_001925 [Botrytis byssoidea]|uniref:Cytochrome b5 heme-binding domain-containing protein n=1 Tax=Botrytis byssoidea TaxID=139641 RepID=A0A9P5M978_9HELO|nr:uncharacterized protein EAE97_001925 [Botrytis byssoidea]KAF7952428.1 hypothetical protein EAE97_001925 [Botrytis byssoidea]